MKLFRGFLILAVLLNSIALAQDREEGSVVLAPAPDSLSISKARVTLLKSIVLPGWGEHSLGRHQKGYLFNGVEAAFWVALAGFRMHTGVLNHDMRSYAAQHSSASVDGKDEVFFTDIGNYNDIYEYNEQKLRYRQYGAVYPETAEFYWSWDSDESRREFDSIRIRHASAARNITFALTGLVANRLVSMFDVMLMTRSRIEMPVEEISSSLFPTRDGMGFSLSFAF